jgi:hypothetical protein
MILPLRIAATFAMLTLLAAAPAARGQLYTAPDLEPDAARLKSVVQKIYSIGLKPALRPDELAGLGEFQFVFPMPRQADDPLNFAATTDGRHLIMPLMSLKFLEDMTTAHAWLHHNGMSLSAIDLYFAMLRYRDPARFPGGRQPKILDALSVPPDAYKTSKQVDEMSLALRNEAIAFVIAHELGHILYRHKPLDQLTSQQALADEMQSDRFALDLMKRTSTPPFGPLLFFQAQLYSLLHRHEFPDEEAWRRYVQSRMIHPVSIDRMQAMANFLRDEFPEARPAERETWQDVGNMFLTHTDTLADIGLARCIIRIAKEADLSILKPRKSVEAGDIQAKCRGIKHE